MTKRFYIILVIAVAVFLLADVVFLAWYLTDQHEQVLFKENTLEVDIYIEPDNTATRAAANYLAYEASQKFGMDLEIVAVREEGKHYISILCEEGFSFIEEVGKDAADGDKNSSDLIGTIEDALQAPVVAAETDFPLYSIVVKKDGLVLSVPMRKNCFGAVKAVTDRWLQPDCGLRKPGELRISRAMIREQLSGLPTGVDGTIRILSQNLRYIDDPNGNSVEERASRFTQLVKEVQPDLIGTQECTFQWLELLKDALSDEYEAFGVSRMGRDSEKEEWNAILFRKDRFQVLLGDTFWLSNTPNTEVTKLNYKGAVRICTWVYLQDNETGKSFLFSNTHLQDGGGEAFQEIRTRQTEILFRQLRQGSNKLETVPGFMTGDFNGEADEPFYSVVTSVYGDAGRTAIDNVSTVDYSFHGYGTTQALIDFCFHSPRDTTVLDYRILDDDYGGYVSDHYGVLVTALVN